jgi:hypothetical protein
VGKCRVHQTLELYAALELKANALPTRRTSHKVIIKEILVHGRAGICKAFERIHGLSLTVYSSELSAMAEKI